MSQTAEWYRDAFVILHVDHHTTEDSPVGRDADPDEVERLVRVADPDLLQIHAKGNPGWTTYPTKVGFTPPGLERDVMRIWVDMAAQLGKPFSAYYNIGRDGEIMTRRPEFNRLNAGGRLLDKAICYHTGVAPDYIWPMIREIIEAYRPAGFWFDGSVFTVQVCYCDACLTKWREMTGRDAPRSPADPDWDQYREMHSDIYRQFVRDTAAMIHETDPDCQVAVNWAYTFRMPEKPDQELAYLTGDIANNLEALGPDTTFMDGQGIPFDMMTAIWYQDGTKDGSPMRPKPDEQLQQEAAVIVSRGGRFSVWDNPTDGSGLVEERLEALGRVASWLRERQPFCQRTENLPDVSILHTVEAHQGLHRDHAFSFPRANATIEGVILALDERHITYEIVAGWRLEERSVKGKLMIVEDPHVLPDTRVEQIAAFAQAGGNVLVSGRAGVTGGVALRELAGLGIVDVRPFDGEFDLRGPISLHLFAAEPDACEVLLWAEPQASAQPRRPLLTRMTRGEGCVLFCPTALFSTPDAASLIDEVLAIVLPDSERTVTLDGPPHVHVTCRRQGNTLIVHLVNRALGERSGEWLSRRITNIPWAPQCAVSIAVDRPPESATLEPGGRAVDWRYEGGRVCAAVPEFALHEMLVVRLG